MVDKSEAVRLTWPEKLLKARHTWKDEGGRRMVHFELPGGNEELLEEYDISSLQLLGVTIDNTNSVTIHLLHFKFDMTGSGQTIMFNATGKSVCPDHQACIKFLRVCPHRNRGGEDAVFVFLHCSYLCWQHVTTTMKYFLRPLERSEHFGIKSFRIGASTTGAANNCPNSAIRRAERYYKVLTIPDLERMDLQLNPRNLTLSHSANTLIIKYAKPKPILELERLLRLEVRKLPESSANGEKAIMKSVSKMMGNLMKTAAPGRPT
ncbi:hypothetical protein BV898_11734 [Hypsibius exemplaris]|uniref:Protein DPCD n=1 Tax=Hypsibius exemplaris TaxID=2072580 RepID=A0A1W0WFV3_HYPEX|nr:hypothetical protein BV898_11734 [Hypsibius exemplaris]